MPRLIECSDGQIASLPEAIDLLDRDGFDPRDEESVANAALALRRLCNNRSFLGDLMIERLTASGLSAEEKGSGYGPQAIVLSGARGSYFLRANIWPSEQDAIFAASGARSFVYGVPHDHNFSFLTAGYFGPGYRSNYYEYDYDKVVGTIGEQVPMRFIERSALGEGKIQLYRAHIDIHSQIPPESLSISLNVMHVDPGGGWFDQYGFDLDRGEIASILNPTSTEAFLRIAVGLGGEEALDLAERFGRTHPSDRLRLASFEARAMLATSAAEKEALWSEAERCGRRLVASEARRYREALELI